MNAHARITLGALALTGWIGVAHGPAVSYAVGADRRVEANRMVELVFASAQAYDDPFNQVQLDALFTTPGGKTLRVPAFWAGGGTWKVRYASGEAGLHRFRTECSDTANAKLHGVVGEVEVVAYEGDNPLYRHGPICVADDKRHFAHADGTPFFWLGDTWWMGLCKRLNWPGEFQTLSADRVAKGFTVVQIVAGLYPDMPAFDERGANEAGFPWTQDYKRIRPEYFDRADERLMYLADQGLVPCIVGAWGYHLPWMGADRIKSHWRYLVARYGALPVVWCAAGEGTMPYYLSKTKNADADLQKREWTEVIRYIRRIDPFGRMITIHPSHSARSSPSTSGSATERTSWRSVPPTSRRRSRRIPPRWRVRSVWSWTTDVPSRSPRTTRGAWPTASRKAGRALTSTTAHGRGPSRSLRSVAGRGAVRTGALSAEACSQPASPARYA